MDMELLIFIIIIGGVLFFLTKRKASQLTLDEPVATAPEHYQYKLKGPLFSAPERSFYGVLSLVTARKAVIFAKVRIADILEPHQTSNQSAWQTAFNKINRKHFDYVLCRPDDLSIICVIELDDKSHNSKKQQERDSLVESACESANLKLHRFKVSDSYSVLSIQRAIFSNISTQSESPVVNVDRQPEEENSIPYKQTPSCPKCSSALVVRVSKKESHADKPFYGCSAYPKCRYIEAIN
jgi:ssDNA-binding Zn-finger/Zn-ribbon topoisomerase 1